MAAHGLYSSWRNKYGREVKVIIDAPLLIEPAKTFTAKVNALFDELCAESQGDITITITTNHE